MGVMFCTLVRGVCKSATLLSLRLYIPVHQVLGKLFVSVESPR